MAGRIVCIADVFDALISERPYKKAWSFDEAMEEIKNSSGSQFDPWLVGLFIGTEDELRNIVRTFALE